MLIAPKIPDPDVEPALSLAAQIGAGGVMIAIVIAIYAAGILGTTRLLGLQDRNLKAQPVDMRAFGLLVSLGLCLFVLHVAEIALFAAFYLWAEAIPSVERALYFSASMYTTLGAANPEIPDEWRLFGAVEGLVGFLMIGWSTAVFVTNMRDVLEEQHDKGERGE